MDEYGAAFGFFPQLKPRRNINTDTSSLPLDVFRGRLAGLLGAPSDILNLLSSPKPMEVFGDVDYSRNPQLPYGSEQWLKELPLPPTSQAGNVLGKAASFVPLNPAPVIRGAQKVGQMAGEELAATMLGQRPNSLLDKVVPKPMFAVAPEQGLLAPNPIEQTTSLLQTKPQAPVSDIGFYSAAEQAAMNIKRNAGPGQAMLNDILKGENVKADEIKWMGLDDFLRDKKNVTKQEVQDYISANKVDVQEVTLDSSKTIEREKLKNISQQAFEKVEDAIPNLSPLDRANLTTFWAVEAQKGDRSAIEKIKALNLSEDQMKVVAEYGDAVKRQQDFIESSNGYMAQPKYGSYTLPGGENYREILLTMPNTKAAKLDARRAELEAKGSNATEADRQEWASIMNQLQPETRDIEGISRFRGIPDYRSGHWEQPNVLAHIRVNDRVDADGKKMLLIEEVQSDWHQAGREKGYKTKESLEKWYNQNKLDNDPAFADLNSEQRSVIERNRNAGMGGDNAVPDAPFKDTWYQLALKRAMKYAADNGYDRIGLTTGARQAERYDLSKQIKTLIYGQPDENGLRRVEAITPSGDRLLGKKYTEDEIAQNVGKEIAEKIIKNTGEFDKRTNTYAMTGLDLKVGGEGMKKYYDEIYPKFLDKYGKKWGARVGETTVPTERSRDASGIPSMYPQHEPIRYIDITPEMRTSTSKGQPLFSAAPLLPTTGLLADEEKRKELKSLLEY